jgi:sulfoacetaldehyde dehydrogenase
VLRGGETVRPGPASEKLAPVVTVYVDEGFDGLLTRADRVLDVDGAGHSCVLHTDREDRVERFARAVDVCRAVVNQPGALGLPGYGNGLDATLCLGAGVWGGNQLDENLTYRHFLTTTRVARPGGAELPDDAALFDGYDRARPE